MVKETGIARQIGCALWSLGLADTVESLEKAAAIGFESVQFALRSARDLEPAGLERITEAIERTGLEIAAGMVAPPGEDYTSIESIRRTGGFVPAERFRERLDESVAEAEALAKLGITHVTTHAGFVPEPDDPAYGDAMGRLGEALDAIHGCGLSIGLETGQESAEVLLQVLDDLARDFVSVNYDPANLILYGTADPVKAATLLAPKVSLVHVKDAVWSDRPGETWGVEMPLGEGAVDFPGVLAALAEGGCEGPLVIEREGGSDRAGDLVAGREWLERLPAGPS